MKKLPALSMYICIIWMHCLSRVKKHFKVANDSMKLIPKVENPYREWMWCTAHITYPDIAAWLISIMLSHDSSCDCFLASLTLHVPDQLQFSPERLLDHNNSTCRDYIQTLCHLWSIKQSWQSIWPVLCISWSNHAKWFL